MNRPRVWIKMLAALCVVALLGGCSNNAAKEGTAPEQGGANTEQAGTSSQIKLVDCHLIEDDQYGSAYLDISIEDFNALGFAFGDGIDVTFSNGYVLHDIPYFDGYYAQTGNPLACGYPGYERVALAFAQGPSLWEQAGLSTGDTATVLLTGAGKYLDTQEAFSLSYSSERSDYADDVTFANFRELSGGELKEGMLYRSASPIDDIYSRAGYVNSLSKDAGIRAILDLADSEEEIAEYITDAKKSGTDVSLFLEIHDAGNVIPLDLGASFMTPEFAEPFVGGLRKLTTHEGPYLINCLEGKDRTGFVSILLEALAGATYDEMCNDYMTSYANYYGITEESDPDRYDIIKRIKFEDIIQTFTHAKADDDLKKMDYVEAARSYLRDGGMTDEEIDHLSEVICR